MEPKDRIIVALDVDSLDKALNLVEKLHPYVGCFKVGLELLTSTGAPQVVKAIREAGGKVFFDGKFMDIPNTIAGASKAVTRLDVDMFNVHCLGGPAMMKEARKAAEEIAKATGKPRPLVLGVTILTSLNYGDLVLLGFYEELNIVDPKELADTKRLRIERLVANKLAWLGQESGLDGVISSPQEIAAIRKYCEPGFLVVTPGVRPSWASAGDQKRVMTPGEAIGLGANRLVIGRPVTQPPVEIGGPVEAAKMIADEIFKAESEGASLANFLD